MANTFTLLSSVTVGSGGSANISISGIPSGYSDLTLFLSLRNSGSQAYDGIYMQVNSLTSGYAGTLVYGDGSSTGQGGVPGGGSLAFIGDGNGNTATAGVFSIHKIHILDYLSSNTKSYSVESGQENNTSAAFLEIIGGYIGSSNSAISSLTITGTNAFQQYSSAYLYGTKNT